MSRKWRYELAPASCIGGQPLRALTLTGVPFWKDQALQPRSSGHLAGRLSTLQKLNAWVGTVHIDTYIHLHIGFYIHLHCSCLFLLLLVLFSFSRGLQKANFFATIPRVVQSWLLGCSYFWRIRARVPKWPNGCPVGFSLKQQPPGYFSPHPQQK